MLLLGDEQSWHLVWAKAIVNPTVMRGAVRVSSQPFRAYRYEPARYRGFRRACYAAIRPGRARGLVSKLKTEVGHSGALEELEEILSDLASRVNSSRHR